MPYAYSFYISYLWLIRLSQYDLKIIFSKLQALPLMSKHFKDKITNIILQIAALNIILHHIEICHETKCGTEIKTLMLQMWSRFCTSKTRTFFKVWVFPGLFSSLIFHQISHKIQYYLPIICPLVVLPYPHHWWFPRLWNSPKSRARTTHSTRERIRKKFKNNDLTCLSNVTLIG